MSLWEKHCASTKIQHLCVCDKKAETQTNTRKSPLGENDVLELPGIFRVEILFEERLTVFEGSPICV